MKTTIQISLGFLFGLLCFVGGYQYFNHTQFVTQKMFNSVQEYGGTTDLPRCANGEYPSKAFQEAGRIDGGGKFITFGQECEDGSYHGFNLNN